MRLCPNSCGKCKHWHEWPEEKQDCILRIGDCDKISKGTPYEWKDRKHRVHRDLYCGWSFEDECYDDEYHCFEPVEEE